MSFSRHAAPAACCLLMAALLGCGADQAAKQAAAPSPPETVPGQASFPPDSPMLSQIRVEPVEMAKVQVDEVTAPGKIEVNANRLSNVMLPVAGRITSVMVKIGDFVHRGQPLLLLESADADAAVSAYQQAEASLTQAKSALAKSQADQDREKDLFEHGATPQKDLLNAQAVTVQSAAAVEQAQAALEQARRRLQILGIGSSAYGQHITINAPISGKVLAISVVDGVFRNDLAAPVMTIADLSTVWVTADVPETSIRFVSNGMPATIQLSAYPGESFRGRVTQISDLVDPQTRTVEVRAELPNPDGRLKPEMFGVVHLGGQTEDRPTVPAASVISAGGKTLVWKQIADGRFQRIAVTTGAQTDGRIAVLNGLAAQDRIVVDGVMLLSAD
ncbi:MAG: efflux RND transporter periplasmic adaptor subunit [Bryobacterales bacterium]|nr:efflux RND transporter periplasmic adaptor subunit [Bryobacterales bacterium]